MDSQRLFERIGEYHKALRRLRDALSQPEDDFMRDSIIQRFEFTFELAWKALKLWLEFKNIDARTPHDVLKESLNVGMIEDGNGWTEMQKARNKTSHTYDEKQAIDIVLFVRKEGVALLNALDMRFAEIVKDVK